MAYDIFHGYGLDKIHDSYVEDFDYKDSDTTDWKLVKVKSVQDSDGFLTDYAWYTDGSKHIFMFGDTDLDLYAPDEDYADHVAESQEEAASWFDAYEGFNEEPDVWESLRAESVECAGCGNKNFMNDGFDHVYGNGTELED